MTSLPVFIAAGAIAAGAITSASLRTARDPGAATAPGPRGRAPTRATEAPPDPRSAPAGAHEDLARAPLFPAEGGPITPGPPPRGLASTSAADCATCHAEIAVEWAGSAHARSWRDPIFQAEYRLTGQAFCRHCHAPLVADPRGDAPGGPAQGPHPAALDARADAAARADADPAARAGIDCAVCHVRDGHVLGVRGAGALDHAARADPRLEETAQCAACHQFSFPARADRSELRYHPGRPLQDTVAEWRASRYADRACQACHMRRVGAPGSAHASHAFAALGDPAALARAVEVTARAVRRGRQVDVTLTLTAREIGHAFPTGDMFRRAVITVRAGAASRVAVLTREFAPTITDDARGHLLGQVDDTRLPAPGAGPPVTRAITLEAPTAREATWTLALDRLDPDDAAARGLELSQVRVPVSAGRVPIAR